MSVTVEFQPTLAFTVMGFQRLFQDGLFILAVESDGNGFGNPVGGVGSYRNPPATPLSVVVVDPLVTLGDKNVKTPTEDTAQAEVCRLLSGILITLLRWTNATRDQLKEERERGRLRDGCFDKNDKLPNRGV